jgi:glucose/mannose-6-phosphate isomerase
MTDTKTPLLDTKKEIEKIDQNKALQSIEVLGSQVQHIWEEAKKINLDASYKKVTSVVVAGMGGSVLGTDVIRSLFNDQLQVPIIIAPDYTVPAFVNENTLVIVSSYSGNTEETFSAAQDAHKKGAKLIAITTGGKIAAYFKEHSLPALVYEPKHNPSQCARMGLGYSIFGQMALFAKADLITLGEKEYKQVLDAIAETHLKASQNVLQESNLAKVLAFNLVNKIPVITASEHLEGIAHVFANQLNENAKTFAEYRVIPELNHHLMEGLLFPQSADSVLQLVTIHSDLYHPSNSLRMTITEEIIEQHHLELVSHTLTSKTKIGQAFELLTLAAYTAFYLAMLYNQDPIPNPNVDLLKSELKKRS